MTVPAVASTRLSSLHPVRDQLQVGTVRLRAAAMARAHGLEGEAVDRVTLVVGELGANIIRHAHSGHLVLRTVGDPGTGCFEILALDKGPGIPDMTRAMRDDRAAAREDARGSGFPAVRRNAELFDIYSQFGRGTAVVVHIGSRNADGSILPCGKSVMHHGVGVVSVPLVGEDESGDDWAVEFTPGRITALLVDGLGHGPGAAIAALGAMTTFRNVSSEAPEVMLTAMHTALRDTRGAALSVFVADPIGMTARFAGVGNVDGRIVTSDTSRQLLPQSGIVGHTMPRLHTGQNIVPRGAHLVLHSDGISSRWRADQYPGLLSRHPSLLAGVIFRDFGRARDDATVLVIRDLTAGAAA